MSSDVTSCERAVNVIEDVTRPVVAVPEDAGAQASVNATYAKLAPLYDVVYGALLQPGRRRAMTRLAAGAGERILEVGVGTGLTIHRYPAECRVTAIDVSGPMLRRAAARKDRRALAHVQLSRMDAMHLAFADATFDAVYVPYLLNVVPDPVRAVREIARVCRPGGRVVLLNHFDRTHEAQAVDRIIGRLARMISDVNWRLPLEPVLAAAGLDAISIEPVNVPKVSAVVVCARP